MKPIIMGISGGTGSGKTFIANQIKKSFEKNEVLVLNQDAYYYDLGHIPFEKRIDINFDHPDSIDIELLCTHISKLISGESVKIPVYDFSRHVRSDIINITSFAKMIIIEGIFSLYYPALRKLYTMKIFVDTPENIRLKRRITRDILERGRSKKSVEKQYIESVAPMHKLYVKPTRKYADIVVQGDGNSQDIIKIIKSKITSLER